MKFSLLVLSFVAVGFAGVVPLPSRVVIARSSPNVRSEAPSTPETPDTPETPSTSDDPTVP